MSHGKPPAKPHATPDKAALETGIDRIVRHIKELRGLEVASIRDRWDTRLEVLQKKINSTLSDALGHNSPDYKKHTQGSLDSGLDSTFGERYSTDELQQALKKGIASAVSNLESAKKLLGDRLQADPAAEATAPAPTQTPAPPPPSPPPPTPAPTQPPPPPPAPTPAPTAAPTPAPTAAPKAAPTPAPTQPPPPAPKPSPAPSAPPMTTSKTGTHKRVALVGPLDETASQASELLDQLGLEAVVVGKPAGAKDAVSLEALEGLRDVDYAIVMAADEAETPTAMLTLGFLLAVLGRGRLCFLAAPSQSSFPALGDAVRVTIDEGGLWRLLMAREMKKAGLDVDLNRAI